MIGRTKAHVKAIENIKTQVFIPISIDNRSKVIKLLVPSHKLYITPFGGVVNGFTECGCIVI